MINIITHILTGVETTNILPNAELFVWPRVPSNFIYLFKPTSKCHICVFELFHVKYGIIRPGLLTILSHSGACLKEHV